MRRGEEMEAATRLALRGDGDEQEVGGADDQEAAGMDVGERPSCICMVLFVRRSSSSSVCSLE